MDSPAAFYATAFLAVKYLFNLNRIIHRDIPHPNQALHLTQNLSLKHNWRTEDYIPSILWGLCQQTSDLCCMSFPIHLSLSSFLQSQVLKPNLQRDKRYKSNYSTVT